MSYNADQNVSIGENEAVNLNREDSELTATEKLIKVKSLTNSASDKDKKDKELDLYEKMQRCERNCDVLSWWKENSVILPALSGIAKAVLCVPAGSVASEQLFSVAGLFDTVKRGSLNVETLESLTLLKANQLILEELKNLSDEESVADSDEENEEEDSVDSPRSV